MQLEFFVKTKYRGDLIDEITRPQMNTQRHSSFKKLTRSAFIGTSMQRVEESKAQGQSH